MSTVPKRPLSDQQLVEQRRFQARADLDDAVAQSLRHLERARELAYGDAASPLLERLRLNAIQTRLMRLMRLVVRAAGRES